jgi:hypothetical protein
VAIILIVLVIAVATVATVRVGHAVIYGNGGEPAIPGPG